MDRSGVSIEGVNGKELSDQLSASSSFYFLFYSFSADLLELK